MLSCNLVELLDTFLSNELSREVSLSANRRKVVAEIVSCRMEGEVYCASLSSSTELSLFEEITWVEVKRGRSVQHASLWVVDEKQPYLILSQAISPGPVQLSEADGIQLIEMQKQALNTLKEKKTNTARLLWNCIIGSANQPIIGHIDNILIYLTRKLKKLKVKLMQLKSYKVLRFTWFLSNSWSTRHR